MQSYILAIVGIGGALLGAWLNAVLARRAEDRRWKRERETRYDEKRLEAYARYLAVADRIHNNLTSLWAKYPEGPRVFSPEYPGLIEELTQDVWEVCCRAALIGRSDVSTKASVVHRVLLTGLGDLTEEERDVFHRSYYEVRGEFFQAARDDLGLA